MLVCRACHRAAQHGTKWVVSDLWPLFWLAIDVFQRERNDADTDADNGRRYAGTGAYPGRGRWHGARNSFQRSAGGATQVQSDTDRSVRWTIRRLRGTRHFAIVIIYCHYGIRSVARLHMASRLTVATPPLPISHFLSFPKPLLPFLRPAVAGCAVRPTVSCGKWDVSTREI